MNIEELKSRPSETQEQAENRRSNWVALRAALRTRDDLQRARIAFDSRIGRKANGEDQNIDPGARFIKPEDRTEFIKISDELRAQERVFGPKIEGSWLDSRYGMPGFVT